MLSGNSGSADQLVYMVSAWKAGLELLVLLALLAVAIWFAFSSHPGNAYEVGRAVVVLAVALPSLTLLVVRLIRQLVFGKPRLTISSAGIDLHWFPAGKGPIPWSEIAAILAIHSFGQDLLLVSLQHPAALRLHQRGLPMSLSSLIVALSTRNGQFAVSDLLLPVSVTDIARDIRYHYGRELQRHGIVMTPPPPRPTPQTRVL